MTTAQALFEQSKQIEAAIVGILLIADTNDRLKWLPKLRPELFVDALHRAVVSKMIEDPTVDISTLKMDSGALIALAANVPLPWNLENKIAALRDNYIIRELYRLFANVRADSVATELLSRISNRVVDLMAEQDLEDGSLKSAAAKWEEYKKKSSLVFVSDKMNKITHGLKPGQIWVVGGRTGSMKSYFALDSAMQQALSGKKVLFFSTELSAEENYRRLVGLYQYYGDIPDVDVASRALQEFDDLKLYTSINTTEEILNKIKAENAISKVDMIVVDHLQEIDTGDKEYESISKACVAFKNMAISLGISVILVSQLNRESQDKKHASVFHGSGKIEQIAHVAIVLEKLEDTALTTVNLSIRKNRGGQTGSFKFRVKFPEGVFQPLD